MPDEMFNEAVQALKAGQRLRARDLLARLIKVDSSNPDYWLWMSATVDSEKEQIFCLQNALKHDPNSIAARRGLVLLGAMRPEEAGLPPPNVLEDTRVAIPAIAPGAGVGGVLANRRSRETLAIVVVGGVALVAVVAACLTVLAPGLLRPQRFVVVTDTPGPTRLAAASPTGAPVAAGACQLPADPDPATPMAVYLCLTQTPTPGPVSTEASVSENYNSLKTRYQNADWADIVAHAQDILGDNNVPQTARVFFYLAEAYRHTGDLVNAGKYYSSAIQKDINFAPAFWGRALVEIAQGKRQPALADFDQAIQADPTFVASYIDRAAFVGLTGDPAGALSVLQRAQAAAPRNALVLARLALAYVDTGQASLGLSQANSALAIDRGLALGYFARGRAEYAQAAFAAADQDLSWSYRYVLALDSPLPGPFQATVLEATALGKAADHDAAQALALLSQAISLDATNASLYINRAGLYMAAGRFEDARADFAAAVSQMEKTTPRDPALVDAYVGLGQALLALNRASDAVSAFQSATRLAPNRFDANLGLGQAALGAGKSDIAIAAFTAALSAAASPAQSAQAHFGRAQAYQAAGQLAPEAADWIAYLGLATASDPLQPTAAARLTQIGPLATATATVTATPTASPTTTATTTRTATPTRTPTPTRTSTPTRTPTLTATVTPTRTPTVTRTPTGTPRISPTPTTTAGP